MEDNKEFSCHYCNYETNKPSDWLKHCASGKHNRLGQKKSHECDECDYTTKSAWNMKLHNLSQHCSKKERSEQKYYCSDCDVVFFAPLYKEKHMNGIKHKNYVKSKEEQNKINNCD